MKRLISLVDPNATPKEKAAPYTAKRVCRHTFNQENIGREFRFTFPAVKNKLAAAEMIESDNEEAINVLTSFKK